MITAYIDGGARGNPGPAGYGVRIAAVVAPLAGPVPTATSLAEVLAAILVTHNLAAVAQTAERIVYLEAGRLRSWGLPQELLGRESLGALGAFLGHDHHASAPDEE